MGFYAPAQIVRDARAHGVAVYPVDVGHSDWDCTLEGFGNDVALRLGFRQVKGLSLADAEKVTAVRGDLRALRRAGVGAGALETIARADAFRSLGLDRRRALWAVRGLGPPPLPLFAAAGIDEAGDEPAVPLPAMAPGEQVIDDYRALRLSLKAHPLALLRGGLTEDGFVPCRTLQRLEHGRPARVAGLVVTRQRPGSAKGVIFITLEDESGIANLIVWPKVFEEFRKPTLGAGLLGIAGTVQRQGLVIHVVCRSLVDLTPRLAGLGRADPIPAPVPGNPLKVPSRDFH